MRTLLINPIIRLTAPPSFFPLGLGYVASMLRADGHKVDVLDINAHRWSPQEVEEKICSTVFDLVGITSLITEYRQVKWLSKLIKKYHPSCYVVIGGGLAISVPELVLKQCEIDVAVIGEGEDAICEILDAYENNLNLNSIKGIAFKQQNKVVITEPRQPNPNLDAIPFPAYDLFPTEMYTYGEKLAFGFPARVLNIITSRGCPYRCIYCDHSIFGYRFRQRSTANVIAEMQFLKRQFRVDGIVFSDDTFILNKKWVYKFCDMVIKERLNIPWMCNGRVNLIDKKLVARMKAAGCQAIFFGIESGSQRILDAMHKNVTVNQAEQAIEICRKEGLHVTAYFMIGMMGESAETIKETVSFCKKMRLNACFSYVTPIPKTALYNEAKQLGIIDDIESLVEKWDKWQDKLLVNLSQMNDEELIKLKDEAEKEINANVQEKVFEKIITIMNRYNIELIIKIGLYKIMRHICPQRDPYLRILNNNIKLSKKWKAIV